MSRRPRPGSAWGGGDAGAAGAATTAARDNLVAAAARAREQRAVEAAQERAAKRIQTFMAGAGAQRCLQRQLRTELATKLQQLSAVAAALQASKGVRFAPPAAVLVLLSRQLLVSVSPYGTRRGLTSPSEVGLLVSIATWLARSARQPEVANVLCAGPATSAAAAAVAPLLRSIVALLSRTILSAAGVSHDLRLVLVEALDALCGGATAGPGEAAAPLVAGAMASSLGAHLLHKLDCCTHLLRPLAAQLLRTDDEGGALRASTADRELVSRVVCVCLRLAGAGESQGTGARLLGTAARTLFSLPFVVQHLEGTPAAVVMRTPAVIVAAITPAVSGAPLGLPPLPVAPLSLTLLPSIAAPAPAGARHPVSTFPVPDLGQRIRPRAPGPPAANYFSASLTVWPIELFFMGNLLQLVADGEPGSPNGPPLAASLPVPDLTRLLGLFVAWMGAVPWSVWLSTGTPLLWVEEGPRPATPASRVASAPGRGTPHQMPRLLSQQLRRLSSERLARALARACVWFDPTTARTPRLRLPFNEDPERGTYEDTHSAAEILSALAELEQRRRSGAAGGSSSSMLSATPSGAQAVLKGVWAAGARLANTIFSRTAHVAAARRGEPGTSGGSSSGGRRGAATLPPGGDEVFGALDAGGNNNNRGPVDAAAVFAFARLYADLTAPLPHGSKTPSSLSGEAEAIVGRTYILSALAYSPSLRLAYSAWAFLIDVVDLRVFLRDLAFKGRADLGGPPGCSGPWAVLGLLVAVLGQLVPVLEEEELYGRGSHDAPPAPPSASLPLREMRHLIRFLLDVMAHAEGVGCDDASAPGLLGAPEGPFWPRFRASALSLLYALYDRHSQRPLGPSALWLVDAGRVGLQEGVPAAAAPMPHAPAAPQTGQAATPAGTGGGWLRALGLGGRSAAPAPPPAPAPRAASDSSLASVLAASAIEAVPRTLLGLGGSTGPSARELAVARRLLGAGLPFAVPFRLRAALFDAQRAADRHTHQSGLPPLRVRVVRGPRLFESAVGALASVRGEAWRRKFSVTFVSEHGVEEVGIDAGGLFKELWTSLAALVFDPAYGLWRSTEATQELYPNPASAVFSGLPDVEAFEFCGRLLGKALYEGITVGPLFASFFLRSVAGLGGGVHLHHLPSLDPDLYRSLLLIKGLPAGDVADLCLSFTVPSDDPGGGAAAPSEQDLIPGGADVPVTAGNRLRYIHLVANWRLSAAMARQTQAFARGLREVIPPAWLAPFSTHELQVLVSGASGTGAGGIDIEDLKAHTQYAGGYSSRDRVIADFWTVAKAMSPADRAALLRFATSCDKAPALGFAQLDPPFTIQRHDPSGASLPSASTCFHVLRLPPYASARILSEKLQTAIHSGSGFHLT